MGNLEIKYFSYEQEEACLTKSNLVSRRGRNLKINGTPLWWGFQIDQSADEWIILIW